MLEINSLNISQSINNFSMLKFYAEYHEYVSAKYSDKYLSSVTTIFNHLFKYFGKTKSLQEIESHEWDKFFLQLFKKSPGGVPVYLRTLKAAFNKALEWNILAVNPLKKIKLPKRQQEEQIYLSAGELNNLLEGVLSTQIRLLIKTAFYTGLRRSELINLKVKHIDLENGFLIVGGEDLTTKSRRIPVTVYLLSTPFQFRSRCVSTPFQVRFNSVSPAYYLYPLPLFSQSMVKLKGISYGSNKRKLLGDISGKLGDSIYRQRNGKVVVYSRPAYVNPRMQRKEEAGLH